MKSWRQRAVVRILLLVATLVAEDDFTKKEIGALSNHLLYSDGSRGDAAVQ